MEIKVMSNILEKNDAIAARLRQRFAAKGILVLNLMGSPGCGKTTLLENTIAALKARLRVAVIEGDLFTDKDARRIEQLHVPVIQINTEGGCHLEASMVEEAVNSLNLDELDLVLVENVGNLVCPAEFDIGEDAKIVVLSVTEGDDKPAKYRIAFSVSKAAVINKMDLLPHTSFDMELAEHDIKSANSDILLFKTSFQGGQTTGLSSWLNWIKDEVRRKKEQVKGE